MKLTTTLIMFLIGLRLAAQDAHLTGSVTDQSTHEPLPGASITVKGKLTGTITDNKGAFRLSIPKIKLPATLLISSAGYEETQIEIDRPGKNIQVALERSRALDEVVFSASRINESILRSPVSIEKMNLQAIRENPSFTFYDGLQNLKGMDVVTSSLTYKQVNSRGFNTTGNSRFLQLLDGVDNQTPGLNFAIGNQFGASDIDVESAELIPGAASALYGPVAFNGLLNIRTKDPFKYQGLTAQVKTGINHVGEDDAKPQAVYDVAIRFAKAFNNKFAFKINASYLTGLDWYATNYTDISAQTAAASRGPNNPGRDALNIYGDEVSKTLPGVGLVSRTGYEEKDLMNYQVYSFKANGALHYRISDNLEAIYQYNYGRGTASYTGSSRFDLNNFVLQTHRIELKGTNFFIRSYAVVENSHDSYNTRSLAQFINRTWVKNPDGSTATPDQADNIWFDRYSAAYNGDVNGVGAASATAARSYADQGRLLPGSPAFDAAKSSLIHNYGLQGAGVFSNSKFYHTEGQYDFTRHIKIFELLAGGSFRYYDMFTNGSLFNDKNSKVTIKEYGAFAQAAKSLFHDNLKITASMRYDKNENFSGSVTPRLSAVYTVAKDHHFRVSYQTGFRNPTPVDQFINLNVGPITILGGTPANSKGTNAYENSFTAASVGAFGGAFGAAVGSGTPFNDALMNNKQLLQKSNVPYIEPEKQKAFEVGYKALIAQRLVIDLNYYYSTYTNFILNTVVIRPDDNVIGPDGTVNPAAAGDILSGKVHAFQLYTNASDKVSAQGAGAGLTYMLRKGYSAGANLTWSSFHLGAADANNVAAFNTPKWSTNFTFGNPDISHHFGFNLAWHWQDAFDWYGTFTGNAPGRIGAYSLVDLQFSKKLVTAKTTVRIGASNLFNNKVYTAYGSPAIGGLYYVALTFDDLLK